MYCSKGESFLIDNLIEGCCVRSNRFNKQSIAGHLDYELSVVDLMAEELIT